MTRRAMVVYQHYPLLPVGNNVAAKWGAVGAAHVIMCRNEVVQSGFTMQVNEIVDPAEINRGHHVCKKNNYVILTASAIKGSPARLNEVPINRVSLPHVSAAAAAFHFRVRGDSAVVNHQSIAQSWWLMLIDDIHPTTTSLPSMICNKQSACMQKSGEVGIKRIWARPVHSLLLSLVLPLL